MPRPTNKTQLLVQSNQEFSFLLSDLQSISPETVNHVSICGNWTVKDLLAHLHEWHQMLLEWYAIGMTGQKPAIPAPGLTWKDTPQINESIYQKHKNVELDICLSCLKSSHQQLMDLINRHTNEELFTKKKYPWTGTTSVGAYLVSCTSSHYVWVRDLIKKAKKANKI